MEAKYARYMRCGKTVTAADETVYVLLESMDEKNGSFRAICSSNYSRYKLLSAWIDNWDNNSYGFRERFTENIDDCRNERNNYIVSLNICDVKPHNTIRFITSDYKTKFIVKDFENILVNEDVYKVSAYGDDYHFAVIEINGEPHYNVYHICEFAEICERHNSVVEPQENTQENTQGKKSIMKR